MHVSRVRVACLYAHGCIGLIAIKARGMGSGVVGDEKLTTESALSQRYGSIEYVRVVSYYSCKPPFVAPFDSLYHSKLRTSSDHDLRERRIKLHPVCRCSLILPRFDASYCRELPPNVRQHTRPAPSHLPPARGCDATLRAVSAYAHQHMTTATTARHHPPSRA